MWYMRDLPVEAQQKLESAENIWFGSVRPDGRPHLAPVWFVWTGNKLYICIEKRSIKGRNIAGNPQVVLALEDGLNPVICEGIAIPLGRPLPIEVISLYRKKYDWDISSDGQYDQVLEITPTKWLVW
jgi:F420H(2)-dependent biliverdin reductase